jgi:anti-sigma B factor antagonist
MLPTGNDGTALRSMHEDRKLHETSIPGRALEPAGSYTVEPLAGPDGVAILSLAGELDIAAAPAIRAHVDAAAGSRGLVIDLAEATFVDSTVLKELLRAQSELARYETGVVLAAVPRPVHRLLDLTRTERLFTIAADRASALRQLER